MPFLILANFAPALYFLSVILEDFVSDILDLASDFPGLVRSPPWPSLDLTAFSGRQLIFCAFILFLGRPCLHNIHDLASVFPGLVFLGLALGLPWPSLDLTAAVTIPGQQTSNRHASLSWHSINPRAVNCIPTNYMWTISSPTSQELIYRLSCTTD